MLSMALRAASVAFSDWFSPPFSMDIPVVA